MDYLLTEIHKPSDTRVKDWFLLDYNSPIWLSIILTFYLTLAYIILPAIRRNRVEKIPNFDKFMGLYNALVVLTNLILATEFAWNIYKVGYNVSCQPIEKTSNNNYENNIAVLQWWFFILKIFELVDVIFARLRRIPLLGREFKAHTYHHSTILIFCWAGAKYLPGGSTSIMSLLNCLIHVLLYFYFLLRSTFGITFLRSFPFKSVLATVTLIQFLLVIFHCIAGLFVDCGYPSSAFIIVTLLVISYVEAFYGCLHCIFLKICE